jgi:hypothetical protein
LNHASLLHDNVMNMCYLLIPKNGSSSLSNLTLIDPDRYTVQSKDFVDTNNITKVVVFVRDPIERYLSGLNTQLEMYKFDPEFVLDLINKTNYIPNFDLHTTPQFWFLITLSRHNQIEFDIRSIKDIQLVDSRIEKCNVSNCDITLTDAALDHLDHLYTEDIVLYNQFMNKTTQVQDVVSAIKKETTFIDDLRYYKTNLTYLLD